MELISNFLQLNENELNSLQDDLKQKITNNQQEFYDKYQLLKNNYEKFKIEYEQKFVELETEYTECRTKYECESTNCRLYKSQCSDLDEKCKSLVAKTNQLENERDTLNSCVQRQAHLNQNLEAEKRDLIVMLDKRNLEIDRINEDWKCVNRKLAEAQARNGELIVKLEEVESIESNIKIKEKHFQIEKERLMIEMDWLNKQLTSKSSSLLELKDKTTREIYELESKCDDLTAENKKIKSQCENLMRTSGELSEQNEELNKKLQELREAFAKSKALHDEESIELEKLVTHYKSEMCLLNGKLEEASKMIVEFQEMLVEAKNEYSNLALEKENNEVMFNATLRERDEHVIRLDQELKNANELLSIAKRKGATVLSESDIEELSPAAAVASRLLKSGMTLTQIYSEYVNLSEALSQEKGECERLRAYINEIMNEIEEKGPILKRQKIEFEEALQANSNLTAQLEKSMMDYEILKTKSEDSIKKYNFIQSENVRLKQDVVDLSRQVTSLLHEVEMHRKSKLSMNSSMLNTSTAHNNSSLVLSNDDYLNDPEVSSSSEIITKHFIEFRNLEELQKQNQKLIRFAREVSESKQSEEKAHFEAKTKEYNEKLELAFKHVEEMKNQREKQEKILEEIVRQRDEYKRMLNQQQETNLLVTSTPGLNRLNSSLTTNDSRNQQQQQHDLSEKLQSQFEKYQKETQESMRMLNEECDRSRKHISELNTKLALSESRLESTQEKCKSLNSNADKCRMDCEILKERNEKFNELIIKHEQSISHLSQELHTAKEKLSEHEISVRNLSMERDWYKSNQERLVKENEMLSRENASRSLILSNLETIKSSCERQERETKLMYVDKVDTLEKENVVMRKQLESEQEQHRVLLRSWENQLKELSKRYDDELKLHETTKKALGESETQVESVKKRLNEAEAKLHSSESLLQMTRNSKSSTTITRLTELEEENKELLLKLSLAEKEIVNLKIQLEDTKLHSKQYCSIADNMERTIKESSETNEKTRKMLEEKLLSFQVERDSLVLDLQELNAKYGSLENQLNEQKNQYSNEKNQSESLMNKLQSQLNESNEKITQLQMLLDERTHDRDSYVAQLRITEENLIVESSEKARLSHENLKLQEEIRNLKESQLNTQRADNSSDQVTSFAFKTEKYQELHAKNEELTAQINRLQDELVTMGENIQALQKDTFSTSAASEHRVVNENGNNESLENLIEINRFLRKQKDEIEKNYNDLCLTHEINIERLKSVESENDYARQKNSLYEEEIAKLKLQHKSNVNIDTNEYDDVLESNKRLTEQYTQCVSELDESRMKLVSVHSAIDTLKSDKSSVEFENEKLKGEKVVLESDLKRWKDRLDKLLLNSDLGEEWSKAQEEILALKEKITQLNHENVSIKSDIENYKSELDRVRVESELARGQLTLLKETHQKEFDSMKFELNNKNKKEEYTRVVIQELREITRAVQSELELAEPSQNIQKLPHAEKLKAIKEDLTAKKEAIVAKLKSLKGDLAESKNQNNQLTIRCGELELELNETKERVEKLRLGNQKALDTISKNKKTIEELKRNQAATLSQLEVDSTGELTHELETLKQKYAQIELELNDLKAKQAKVVPSTSVKKSTLISTAQLTQSQAQQPTAYITPSRVTNAIKVNPLARRTAAVQPTPHESTLSTSTRQVLVAPMASGVTGGETWQSPVEPSTSSGITTSSGGGGGNTKRGREDETEDTYSKKSRQSQETQSESEQPQVATIEPYNVQSASDAHVDTEDEQEVQEISVPENDQEGNTNASDGDAQVTGEAAVPVYEEQQHQHEENTNDSRESEEDNDELHLQMEDDQEDDAHTGQLTQQVEEHEYSQEEGNSNQDQEALNIGVGTSDNENSHQMTQQSTNQRAPEITPIRRVATISSSSSSVPQTTSNSNQERKEPIKPIVWDVDNTPIQSQQQPQQPQAIPPQNVPQTAPTSNLRIRRQTQTRIASPYTFVAQTHATTGDQQQQQQIQIVQSQQRIIQQQQSTLQRFMNVTRVPTSWSSIQQQQQQQQLSNQSIIPQQRQQTAIRGGLAQTRGSSVARGRGTMNRGGFQQ